MKYTLAVLALFPSVALAQGIPTPSVPPLPPSTYTLTLTVDDINILWEVLNEGKFRQVNPVINKIRNQIQSEDAARKPPPATETPK